MPTVWTIEFINILQHKGSAYGASQHQSSLKSKLNARRETEGSVKFLVLVGGTQKLNWEWQTQQKKLNSKIREHHTYHDIFFGKKKNCFCFSHLIFRDFFAYLLRIH